MIILRQREFNSKAQKRIREKVEVLRGQKVRDIDIANWHKDADSLASNWDKLSPEQQKHVADLKARAIVFEKHSQEIKKDPYIKPGRLSGKEGFINEQKHLNKKIARSGARSFQEFEEMGGVVGRAEALAKRPRGVKKVRGAKKEVKKPSIQKRYQSLSPKSRAELDRRRAERFEEAFKKSETEARAMRAHNRKAAAVLLPTAAAIGIAGLAIKNKRDKDKKKSHDTTKNKNFYNRR